MKGYNFEFYFSDKNYQAVVSRYGGGPVQYHVTGVSPCPENFPTAYKLVMVWNYDIKDFEWGYIPGFEDFIDAMAAGARDAAIEYGITLP